MSRLIRSFCRATYTAAFPLLCWSVCTAAAWAKDQPEEAANQGKSWILGYVLVVLAIGLGIAVVCRPSRRRTEMDPPPKK